MRPFRSQAATAVFLCLATAMLGPSAVSQQGGGASWLPPGWENKAALGTGQRQSYLDEDDLRMRTRWQMPFFSFLIANSPGISSKNQALWAWLSYFRSCSDTQTLFDDLQGEFGDKARGQAAVDAVEREFKAWAAALPFSTIKLYAQMELGRWDSASTYFSVERKGDFRPEKAGLDGDVFDDTELSLSTNMDGRHTGGLTLEAIAAYHANIVSCASGDSSLTSTLGKTWALYFGRFETYPEVNGERKWRIAKDSDARLPALTMSQAEAQAFVAKFPKRRVIIEIEVAADSDVYPFLRSWDNGKTADVPKHGRLVRVRYLDSAGGVLVDQPYQ